MTDTIEQIHDFWFGELDERGLCTTDRNALWFGANEETDAICRARFGTSLALHADHPQFASFTRYALAHRDVIERFGRFPRCNVILGRPSSAEELDYLAQHGGF